MESCETCHFWLDAGTPRITKHRRGDGSTTEYPVSGPFMGACRIVPPVVVPITSGGTTSLRPYGDGSSYGGGGSYSTTTLTCFPTTAHNEWCGSHQERKSNE